MLAIDVKFARVVRKHSSEEGETADQLCVLIVRYIRTYSAKLFPFRILCINSFRQKAKCQASV